jgi:type IV pilus assembly protein PilC
MASFEYQVIDRDGKLKSGQTEALEEGFLRQDLARQGLFVVGVRQAGGIAAMTLPAAAGRRATRSISTEIFQRLVFRVGLTDLLLFCSQLAVMLEASLQLLQSLRTLAGETANKHFKRSIERVATDIEAGARFADALEKHPWAFNRIFVSLVRVGETGGELPAALKQLTVYLERSHVVRRKILAAMAYPIIIFFITIVMFLIVVLKIVPMFEAIYARVNAPLPNATLMLLWISQGLRHHLLLIVLALVVIAIALWIGVPAERAHYYFDRIKLRLPVFGKLIRKAILAKVCRALASLTQSGVPILDALQISSEIAENRIIEDALHGSVAKVRNGSRVADAMRSSGQFPGLIIQMVSTGEDSGELAAMLEKSAFYYEQQVEATVNALASIIEPILIVTVGIIAGLLLYALYLPIFNLGAAIRGGGVGAIP